MDIQTSDDRRIARDGKVIVARYVNIFAHILRHDRNGTNEDAEIRVGHQPSGVEGSRGCVTIAWNGSDTDESVTIFASEAQAVELWSLLGPIVRAIRAAAAAKTESRAETQQTQEVTP